MLLAPNQILRHISFFCVVISFFPQSQIILSRILFFCLRISRRIDPPLIGFFLPLSDCFPGRILFTPNQLRFTPSKPISHQRTDSFSTLIRFFSRRMHFANTYHGLAERRMREDHGLGKRTRSHLPYLPYLPYLYYLFYLSYLYYLCYLCGLNSERDR